MSRATPRRPLKAALSILAALLAIGAGPGRAEQAPLPGWLKAHVGTEAGQIAPLVLHRARALYGEKTRSGKVKNPCYFAMDATRPSADPDGAPGRRFYTICEGSKTFRATSAGYGNGRKLAAADFSNARQCARHFSNAEGSKLTMGGEYVTAETRTSFKGYIREGGALKPFSRTFLLFDGIGETSNARERAIGGHPAHFLKWQCRKEDPENPHADKDGWVYAGQIVNYTGGRSNGCTTWPIDAAAEIIARAKGRPTTLYIYPEGRDIEAVTRAVNARQGLEAAGTYWNASCLKTIGTPKFWPKRELQPIINAWRRALPKITPRELPICAEG